MFIDKLKNDQRGALLLEILIVVGVLAIIVSLGSQMFLTSARSNQVSRERNTALGLVEEAYNASLAVATENWLNIYQPPVGLSDPVSSKGSSNHYRLSASGTKWVVESGDETIILDGLSFTRYFTVENISRDQLNGNIELVYNSLNDDPSTQKITINVAWPNSEPLTAVQFLTRWRNRVCAQTNWSGGVVSGTSTCDVSGYGAVDTNIDVGSAGSIKLKAQ